MHKNNFKNEQIDGFELTFFQKLKFIDALSNQGGLLQSDVDEIKIETAMTLAFRKEHIETCMYMVCMYNNASRRRSCARVPKRY